MVSGGGDVVDGPIFDPTGYWVWTPHGWRPAHEVGVARPFDRLQSGAGQQGPSAPAAFALKATASGLLERARKQPRLAVAICAIPAILVIAVIHSNFSESAREEKYLQALADQNVIYQSTVHDSTLRPHWIIEGLNVCTMREDGDQTSDIRRTIASWTGSTLDAADVIVTEADEYLC